MIFITVGSQKFQFDRLLKEIDILIEKGIITEEVFGQIGYSDYTPKNYNYKKFLNRVEFMDLMKTCNKVITHGGSGAIIGAIKQNKKIIAVPRLAIYGEHVDDHQLEIVSEFEKNGLICSIKEIDELENSICEVEELKFKDYISNTQNIINEIEEFINKID